MAESFLVVSWPWVKTPLMMAHDADMCVLMQSAVLCKLLIVLRELNCWTVWSWYVNVNITVAALVGRSRSRQWLKVCRLCSWVVLLTLCVLWPSYLLYWLLHILVWDKTPLSLVNMYQQIDGSCCSHLQVKMKLKAAGFSEMLVLILPYCMEHWLADKNLNP